MMQQLATNVVHYLLDYCAVSQRRTRAASEYGEAGAVSHGGAPALRRSDVPDRAVCAAEALWPVHLRPCHLQWCDQL